MVSRLLARLGTRSAGQIGRIGNRGGRQLAQFRWGLLCHPLFTGAVALLAVNDQLLKGWAPGWFTGKASDVAGVVVVAVLIGVAVRPQAALATTAAAWVALKTLPGFAVLAAPVLGGVTRTDPIDLVALAGLVPAGWLLGGIRLPRGDGRALLAVPVLVVTVLATTATSCEPDTMISGFLESGGTLTAVATIGFDGTRVAWAESDDGGLTWSPADQEKVEAPDRTEACRADGRCFRVLDGREVQERIDGDWRQSFAFSDEQDRRMRARTVACDDQRDHLYETTVIVPTPGGDVVVVSMANQGVIRLDPVTDRWERIGVVGLEPVSLTGPSWLLWLYATPLALLLGTPILALAARRRPAGRRAATSIVVAVIGALGLAAVSFLLWFGIADYLWAAPSIAGLSVLVFLVSLWLARRSGPPPPPPPGPVDSGTRPPPAPPAPS